MHNRILTLMYFLEIDLDEDGMVDKGKSKVEKDLFVLRKKIMQCSCLDDRKLFLSYLSL